MEVRSIAAALNKRKSIGIDIDKKYCELSKQRFLNITSVSQKSFILY